MVSSAAVRPRRGLRRRGQRQRGAARSGGRRWRLLELAGSGRRPDRWRLSMWEILRNSLLPTEVK